MRLPDLVVGGLVVLVLASELVHGVDGPLWPIALTVAGAVLWLLARRREIPVAPDPWQPRPAVLIPTFDNIGTVADVVTKALAQSLRVYVVDDGSTDGSGEAARSAGATVITHARNLGKGASLLTGMRAAAADGHTHVLCLDADGQHDPSDIAVFASAVAGEPLACHAGTRDLSTAPGASRFGRRFSNFWIWVETGWWVADSQCGFRAYPIAPVLELGLGGTRYELEVEVLTRLLWSGIPVRDLPCRVYYPPKEERVTSFRPIVDNARITWMNIVLLIERALWPPRWIVHARRGATWTGEALGTEWGWRFVLATIGLFGRRFAYAFTSMLAAWYRVFARDAVHGVSSYVRRSGTTPFRVFRSFAHALVDRLAFVRQGPAAFRYSFDGVEHLVTAFEETRGAILLSAHVGNVEVIAKDAGSAARFARLHVLRFDAEGDHARTLLREMAPEWQPKVIAVNRADGFSALTVLRALRSGAVIAMHGDRKIDDRNVTVEFLGAPAELPAGPWLLAAIARVPVVVMGCFKEGTDGYRVVAMPPMHCAFDRSRSRDEQIRVWAQQYADAVASWVVRYPDQYYNFYDVWNA